MATSRKMPLTQSLYFSWAISCCHCCWIASDLTSSVFHDQGLKHSGRFKIVFMVGWENRCPSTANTGTLKWMECQLGVLWRDWHPCRSPILVLTQMLEIKSQEPGNMPQSSKTSQNCGSTSDRTWSSQVCPSSRTLYDGSIECLLLSSSIGNSRQALEEWHGITRQWILSEGIRTIRHSAFLTAVVTTVIPCSLNNCK